MKYTFEQKLKSVLLVLKSGYSTREVARKIGTNYKHILRWIAYYEVHGEKGLRIKTRSYSADFKLSVITHMHENHLSLLETAVKFSIPSDYTVFKWNRIYLKDGFSGFKKDNKSKMKPPKNQNLRLPKKIRKKHCKRN
ncbi:transposase [Elizabethkingia anophelis]